MDPELLTLQKKEEPKSAERNLKVEIIKLEIESFKSNVDRIFASEDATKINRALDKMIDLHYDQEDRPDGRPYISHPLEIANDLMEKYGVEDADLVIGALMHDSIEDQNFKLFSGRMERKFPEIWSKGTEMQASTNLGDKYQKELSSMALMELGDMYGERVKNLVSHLSNPDFDSVIKALKIQGVEKTKNELYKEHVAEAIKNPDVFVIKYADFARNALSVGNLPEGDRRNKLTNKYGPVIQEVFLPAFKNMSEDHPMYKKREDIIRNMNEEYEKQYL